MLFKEKDHWKAKKPKRCSLLISCYTFIVSSFTHVICCLCCTINWIFYHECPSYRISLYMTHYIYYLLDICIFSVKGIISGDRSD
ncbi:hypothetical protein GDO81_002755 [Engystomops pustulosus]|uniref:Uncharacterized protein n=1 Tax=Engystomops pustulosus TaxID=76066 RepID=A0AAV7DQA0_ENGPU|nr:hypothetical protein GDO81_002755 [Engystomops pustulosus]